MGTLAESGEVVYFRSFNAAADASSSVFQTRQSWE